LIEEKTLLSVINYDHNSSCGKKPVTIPIQPSLLDELGKCLTVLG
jgi:hypothetical protein